MVVHEYIVFETNEEKIFISICIYQFAFGLRFPFYPFFSQILCHFHLSLNQLLPQATRMIMSFIWTSEYMKLPLTLNLFKSVFKLDENKNMTFITFSSIKGTIVVYPELNDLKEYKDKIIQVRVPKTPGHPFRYMPLSFGANSMPKRLQVWMKFFIFLEEKDRFFCTLLNQRTRIYLLGGFHMLRYSNRTYVCPWQEYLPV